MHCAILRKKIGIPSTGHVIPLSTRSGKKLPIAKWIALFSSSQRADIKNPIKEEWVKSLLHMGQPTKSIILGAVIFAKFLTHVTRAKEGQMATFFVILVYTIWRLATNTYTYSIRYIFGIAVQCWSWTCVPTGSLHLLVFLKITFFWGHLKVSGHSQNKWAFVRTSLLKQVIHWFV